MNNRDGAQILLNLCGVFGHHQFFIDKLWQKVKGFKNAVEAEILNYFIWAGINTEEGLRTQTITNEHSANFNRVNGTLSMFTPWYEVFEITPKDKMFILISKRAKIW